MTGPGGRRDPPTAERWLRVQEVFAAAIECEGASRARLLDERCGHDHELRREVESLIASHERPGPIDRLGPAIAPAASWARTQFAGWEGRRVGQYAVLELLEAGGMGVVYKAHDPRLGRHVALKFLPPHLDSQSAPKQRFLIEARAAAALDHPNICTILEIGETDSGQMFLAMPLYDGETVAARLKRGRLPFDEALPIAIQVARGIGAAHAHGVVHRDIKPSNVMVLRDGAVKILDFGIATIEDLAPGGADDHFGTLPYMSPEHVRGTAIDHRSDIWSLGVLLHEMLTSVRPFDASDVASVADAILNREPKLVATSHPEVPAATERVLRRALAKLPDSRYQSMTVFAADLLALLPGGDPAAYGPAGPAGVALPDPAPVSERRAAAVLVTLVSDYGSLIERMAPADARALVGQVRDMAVDAVRRHGGVVNQAIGEEIVSLFGVPAAHDDDELRAVRAAIELHARVSGIGAEVRSRPAIQIQSGLHAGSVVAQRLNEGPRRYGIVGAPATAASRLATAGQPGDIVISEECRRLLSPFVNTVACTPVVLEPGAPPVTPFRVTGLTGLETRLEASARSGLTPYVGRQPALARLEEHVERARSGHGRVVEIVGEAGLGKSRLIFELRKRLEVTGGVTLLRGRCRAFGDVAPYGPFIEIVRTSLGVDVHGRADAAGVVAKVRAVDDSLESFVPLYLHLLAVPTERYPLPRHLQGEHLQAALIDALAAFFTGLSQRTMVAVLVEDWHWADSASRAALARIREIVPIARLLFIVTMRPEAAAPDASGPGGSRLVLEPLDLAAAGAIIAAGLGAGHVSDALVSRIFERTGGNPFFLEQVCRALVEQGAVAMRAGAAVIEGGPETLSLPDTVQAVIRARLDNLEPRARQVVRVAAVFGREFEHALLADVVGEEIDLAPAIARLLDSGLICASAETAATGYRFTHVLTQEVSYESLLVHQRKSLHESAARAFERHHPDRLEQEAVLLARHYSQAEAWREAVHYGRLAAGRASRLSQFAEAFGLLEQVLQWLPHLPDDEESRLLRADLMFEQERACETMGLRLRQRKIILRLTAHLAAAGPSARLAQAYLREGDVLTLLKRFKAADRALSTALQISREVESTTLERNILRSIGLLRWHEGRNQEALALTEDALAIDSAGGDEDAVAGDLVNLASILRTMGDYAGSLARTEEALAMPSMARNPGKLAYALHTRANVYRAMGNLEATLATLRLADQNSAHLLPVQRSFHLTSIAHIELQNGQIDAAIATYRHAIDLSRRARHAVGLAQSLRTLGEVLFELGRHDEALPCLAEAAGLFARLEDSAAEADMWVRAAAARERVGLHAESLEAWNRVNVFARETGDSAGQLNALEGIARALRHLHGANDESVAACAAALDFASTLGEWGRVIVCRNTLGILEWTRGRFADALVHYEAALSLSRERADSKQEGLILNSVGVTLSKLNRLEEARIVLEESVALNQRAGQPLLEAHALAALGHLSRTLGRHERALEQFGRSLQLRRAAGDPAGEAWMWRRIAETHIALGSVADAEAAAAAAARAAATSGDADVIAACAAAVPAVEFLKGPDAPLSH